MNQTIYRSILSAASKQKKQFALLIDPDKIDDTGLENRARLAIEAGVNLFFLGGSLLTENRIAHCASILKQNSNIPVLLFPGGLLQVTDKADGLLFLSLISGRNADLLIGKHVEVAPILANTNLEVIPTGYILVDGGKPTTVSYMSNTNPIPADKPDIAACTALAGEMLGLKLMYMDSGSGAINPVDEAMIHAVRKIISVPLIVGGGMRTAEDVYKACKAGADVIVVGNAIESHPELLAEMTGVVRNYSAIA